MKKFNIVPVAFVAENREAETAGEAIVDFATQMDMNMNNYFKAVPSEDTASEIAKQIVSLIKTNAFSASDCSEIFKALKAQKCILGGKIWTEYDLDQYIEENFTEDTLEVCQEWRDKVAEVISNRHTNALNEEVGEEWNAIRSAVKEAGITVPVYVEWETDGADLEDCGLSETVDIPLADLKDKSIVDWLCDNYEYLVKRYEVVESKGEACDATVPILKGDVTAQNSSYKVRLQFCDEGCYGDFDEEDPQDIPLLRCSIYTKDADDKRKWNEEEPAESACIGISARKTKKEAQALAKSLLEKITELAEKESGWDYILSTAAADFE